MLFSYCSQRLHLSCPKKHTQQDRKLRRTVTFAKTKNVRIHQQRIGAQKIDKIDWCVSGDIGLMRTYAVHMGDTNEKI